MADTNCNGRVFKYAPIALKVHEWLLEDGPADLDFFDDYVRSTSEELGFSATAGLTMLPIMEFAGLIEVDRQENRSHYTCAYHATDSIRGVPKSSPAETEDVDGFTPMDDEEIGEVIAGLFDQVFGGGPQMTQVLHAEATFSPAEVEELFVLHGLATGHDQDRSVGFVNLHEDGSTLGVAINREGSLKITLDGPAS